MSALDGNDMFLEQQITDLANSAHKSVLFPMINTCYGDKEWRISVEQVDSQQHIRLFSSGDVKEAKIKGQGVETNPQEKAEIVGRSWCPLPIIYTILWYC